IQAKRPVFALLNEQSSAVNVLRESRAGRAVTFTNEQLPEPETLAEALAAFIGDPEYSADEIRWDSFEAHSARNSAQELAAAVNRALELFEKRRAPAGNLGRLRFFW